MKQQLFLAAPRPGAIIVSMDLDINEYMEKLAIFPLATVLFPGAILPLHVFEERYKMLMRYAIENGGVFGLSYRNDAFIGRETPPETGAIGCVAKINAVVPLEEGKMNIISTGVVRYRVLGLLQTTPYLLARVEAVADDVEPDADLNHIFEDVVSTCKKFLDAAMALNEANAPISKDLPEDPEAFSLLVSSVLPIDNDSKQALLEITSTRVRLARLRNHVVRALADYNERIKIQDIAKTNGHGRRQ
jgi:Lon protease-like protein